MFERARRQIYDATDSLEHFTQNRATNFIFELSLSLCFVFCYVRIRSGLYNLSSSCVELFKLLFRRVCIRREIIFLSVDALYVSW